MKSHFIGWTSTAPSASATNYITPVCSGGASWSTTEAARRQVVPHAMTVDQLRITLASAPGSGKSLAFTLEVNGSDSALTTTVSDLATSNQDLAHSVSLSAGDTLSIKCVPTGTPTVGTTFWNFRQDATSLFGMTASLTGAPTSGTNFDPILGRSVNNTTESIGRTVMPTSGTIKNLYAWARTAGGAGTGWTFTVVKNGSTTAITCNVNDPATTGNDTTHSITVAAGDTVSMQITETGTPGSTGISWGLSFQPDTDGESFYTFSASGNSGPSTTATRFQSAIESGDSWNATESNVYTRVAATTVKAAYFSLSAAPGAAASGKKYDYTLMKETSATAATVTVLETATTGSITGLSVSVNDDDRLDMKAVPTSTPAANVTKYSVLTFISPGAAASTTQFLMLMGVGT